MTPRQLRLFSILISLLLFAVLVFACVQIRAYNAQRDAEDMDVIARASYGQMHNRQQQRERESVQAANQGTPIDSRWR